MLLTWKDFCYYTFLSDEVFSAILWEQCVYYTHDVCMYRKMPGKIHIKMLFSCYHQVVEF